jgi:hypothetical protein
MLTLGGSNLYAQTEETTEAAPDSAATEQVDSTAVQKKQLPLKKQLLKRQTEEMPKGRSPIYANFKREVY